MTEDIKGKTIVINKPSYALYSAFSDLRNFTANLPAEYRDRLEAGQDSLLFKVQNLSFGARIHNRVPFSRIDLEQFGQAPFPFLLSLFMEPADDRTTWFHIELKAELNMMMKMMLGKKLQEGVDAVTEQIARAASGETPADLSHVSF